MDRQQYILNRDDIGLYLSSIAHYHSQPEDSALLRRLVGKQCKPFIPYAKTVPAPLPGDQYHSDTVEQARPYHDQIDYLIFSKSSLPPDLTIKLCMMTHYITKMRMEGQNIPSSYGFAKVYSNACRHFYGSKHIHQPEYAPEDFVHKTWFKDIEHPDPPEYAPLTAPQMARILSFGIKRKLKQQFFYQATDATLKNTDSIFFKIAHKKSNTHTSWSCDLEEGKVYFAGWSGKHITKQLMANRLALYDALECRQIHSLFGYVGAYAFARYGFIPMESDWDRIRERLQEALPSLSRQFNLAAETCRTLETIAVDNAPRAIWRLVDMPEEIDGQKLSFRIIRDKLRAEWYGTFDMNNREQMTRIRTYIGEDTFDAAMENARRIIPVYEPAAIALHNDGPT